VLEEGEEAGRAYRRSTLMKLSADPVPTVAGTMGRGGMDVLVGSSRPEVTAFYTRDTTIVWEDGQVMERRVFEPDRRINVGRD
jgi:hypothetical protein